MAGSPSGPTALAKALEWKAGPPVWWSIAQTSGSPFAVAPVLEGFCILSYKIKAFYRVVLKTQWLSYKAFIILPPT